MKKRSFFFFKHYPQVFLPQIYHLCSKHRFQHCFQPFPTYFPPQSLGIWLHWLPPYLQLFAQYLPCCNIPNICSLPNLISIQIDLLRFSWPPQFLSPPHSPEAVWHLQRIDCLFAYSPYPSPLTPSILLTCSMSPAWSLLVAPYISAWFHFPLPSIFPCQHSFVCPSLKLSFPLPLPVIRYT